MNITLSELWDVINNFNKYCDNKDCCNCKYSKSCYMTEKELAYNVINISKKAYSFLFSLPPG